MAENGPNLMLMSLINEEQQKTAWSILRTNPPLTSGIRRIHMAIGEPHIINENNETIRPEFKKIFCDNILHPLNAKFMEYIITFGFCCVEWVKGDRTAEPEPNILDYGSYEVKQQKLFERRTQYFCFRKATSATAPMMYSQMVPDLNVSVVVVDPPTGDGELTSRVYTVYRDILFSQTMDNAAIRAEKKRANPLLITEMKESIQSVESVTNLPFYTPGDHQELESQRKSGIQINAVKSAKLAVELAEKQNEGSLLGVVRDPISGLATLDNHVQPNFAPEMFQLPPDQRLVNQQLPLVRPDLVDLKDYTVMMICAILHLPSSVVFPSRTRATVANTEKEDATEEATISFWKKILSDFNEKVYWSLYGQQDVEHYNSLISRYTIERLRAKGPSSAFNEVQTNPANREIVRASEFVTKILNRENALDTDDEQDQGPEGLTEEQLDEQRAAREELDREDATIDKLAAANDAKGIVRERAKQRQRSNEQENIEIQLIDEEAEVGEVVADDAVRRRRLATSDDSIVGKRKQFKQQRLRNALALGQFMQTAADTFEPSDELASSTFWNMKVHETPKEDIISPNRKSGAQAASKNASLQSRKRNRRGDANQSSLEKTLEATMPKFPSVRIVFPGIIDQARLNSLYQRGLMSPAKYKTYIAAGLGIPEQELVNPPLPDVIWQRQQEMQQLQLQIDMQGHRIELEDDQNREQKRYNREMEKAAKEAAKNGGEGGGASTGGGGGSSSKSSKSSGSSSSSSASSSSASSSKTAKKTSSSTSRKATLSTSKATMKDTGTRDRTTEAETKQKSKDADKVKKSKVSG